MPFVSEQGGIPDDAIWSPRRRRPGRHPGDRSGRRPAGPAAARGADLRLTRVRRARARHRAGGRGQVRQGARPRHPDRHGPLRLQDARRQRPDRRAGPRHVPAARDPRPERVLAGRGHGHRRPPQPDHRRARSTPRRRRPGELSGDRHARIEEPRSGLPLGLLRHLLRGSGEPRAGGRLRRPARRSHGQLHRRLQLRVGRWSGTPGRPRLPRALHARRSRRREADLGHRSPQPDPAEGVLRADRPLAQRRPDRLLARRRRRRERHRVDERSRRPAGLRDQGPLARSAHRHDAERQAVGSDPDRRRWHRGRPGRRRPAADRLHPQRGQAARRRDQGRGSPGRERRRS